MEEECKERGRVHEALSSTSRALVGAAVAPLREAKERLLRSDAGEGDEPEAPATAAGALSAPPDVGRASPASGAAGGVPPRPPPAAASVPAIASHTSSTDSDVEAADDAVSRPAAAVGGAPPPTTDGGGTPTASPIGSDTTSDAGGGRGECDDDRVSDSGVSDSTAPTTSSSAPSDGSDGGSGPPPPPALFAPAPGGPVWSGGGPPPPPGLSCPLSDGEPTALPPVALPLPAAAAFNALFGTPAFLYTLYASRGKSSLQVPADWSPDPTTGHPTRTVTYTKALTMRIGPASTRVAEAQTLSAPAGGARLELSMHSLDAPFGGVFRVRMAFTLTDVDGGGASTMAATVGVTFVAAKVGRMTPTGRIERGALTGATDSAAALQAAAVTWVTDAATAAAAASEAAAKRRGERRTAR
ncbi:hypothetical protein BU14_2523s0001, partial [Porphyra umbilicalis]